jgi:hypothetical protein
MGYMKLNLKLIPALIVTCLIGSTGCGANLPTSLGSDPKVRIESEPDSTKQNDLKGVIALTDGTRIDLAQTAEPFVLMFATYTCLSCKGEATKLVQYFATKPGLPTNARLITVLVGGTPEQALRWRNRLGITWSVGVDPESRDPLFFERCTERLTPCVLIERPSSGLPVKKLVGDEASIETLEKESGPWRY